MLDVECLEVKSEAQTISRNIQRNSNISSINIRFLAWQALSFGQGIDLIENFPSTMSNSRQQNVIVRHSKHALICYLSLSCLLWIRGGLVVFIISCKWYT